MIVGVGNDSKCCFCLAKHFLCTKLSPHTPPCCFYWAVPPTVEDPFGHDESDLPLEKFCALIEGQINAIEERATIIPFNMAYGPGYKSGMRAKSDAKMDVEMGGGDTDHLSTCSSSSSLRSSSEKLLGHSYHTFGTGE